MALGITVQNEKSGNEGQDAQDKRCNCRAAGLGGRKVAVVAAARRASPLEDRNLLTWSRSMSA